MTKGEKGPTGDVGVEGPTGLDRWSKKKSICLIKNVLLINQKFICKSSAIFF